jgi:hypothetical protein
MARSRLFAFALGVAAGAVATHFASMASGPDRPPIAPVDPLLLRLDDLGARLHRVEERRSWWEDLKVRRDAWCAVPGRRSPLCPPKLPKLPR